MTTILIDGCRTPADVVHLLRDQYYDVRGTIFIKPEHDGRFVAAFDWQGPDRELVLTDDDLIAYPKSAWKPSDTLRVHA